MVDLLREGGRGAGARCALRHDTSTPTATSHAPRMPHAAPRERASGAKHFRSPGGVTKKEVVLSFSLSTVVLFPNQVLSS